jgi:hypothetical protein
MASSVSQATSVAVYLLSTLLLYDCIAARRHIHAGGPAMLCSDVVSELYHVMHMWPICTHGDGLLAATWPLSALRGAELQHSVTNIQSPNTAALDTITTAIHMGVGAW